MLLCLFIFHAFAKGWIVLFKLETVRCRCLIFDGVIIVTAIFTFHLYLFTLACHDLSSRMINLEIIIAHRVKKYKHYLGKCSPLTFSWVVNIYLLALIHSCINFLI